MKTQPRTQLVLMLAAGLAFLGSNAQGQYQTQDSTGRILDANNRLGSEGVNDSRRVPGGASADDIVYGNVTGGRQFRGNVGSTDERAFRGTISRPSDNLVREGGMSVYQRGEGYDPYSAQRYYGDQRGVNSPMNFARLQPGSPGTFEVTRPTFRIPGDVRMDATIPNPEFGASLPTQYVLPGINNMRPDTPGMEGLTGVRHQPGLLDESLMPSRDLMRRLELNEARIREMRDEYRRMSEENSSDLTLPVETPINDPVGGPLSSANRVDPMSGSLNTQQSLRQRLLTATPMAVRQNEQYAALHNRLDRFRQRREMTDEEANRQFMQEWANAQQQQQQQTAVVEPQARTPEEVMASVINERDPSQAESTLHDELTAVADDRRSRMALRQRMEDAPPPVTGILPPQPDIPVRIFSFAEGVRATGLKTLLTDAEKAMNAGKFTQALDYYDAAAVVAPDDSMVLMGRAVAELGAGYYTRAQTHLEEIMNADPAMLMARYDLKFLYGEDRLQYIVRDLKDLARTESRQARPLFLLAFIAYSTENTQRTSDYLDLAEQRGGSAEFYNQLREHWRLVAGDTKRPAVE